MAVLLLLLLAAGCTPRAVPSEGLPGAAAPEGQVRLAIVGDVLLGGSLAGTIAYRGPDWPWAKAAPILRQADIAIANLETAVTTGGTPAAGKQYTFRSHPRTLSGAANAGIDLVTLANNHTLDYGQEALLETIHHVKEAGLLAVGAGQNIQEAYAPAYFQVRGVRIAVLSFTRVLPFGHWAAGENHPGLAPGWDPKVVLAAVRKARAAADVVVVLPHWGEEVQDDPPAPDVDLAGQLVRAGATVVAGHHAHVLQGLHRRGRSLVAYSLGNFIFTTVARQLNQETGILEVTVDRQGVLAAHITPMYIYAGQPGPVNPALRAKILSRLDRLSQRWGTRVAPDGTITAP
jgi:poly-gamma-glutamate synthesis protein (capsule biosynthesis protein)